MFLRVFNCLLFVTLSFTQKRDRTIQLSAAEVLKKAPLIGESCQASTDCPANSFCALRKCDGLVCMCQMGLYPSEDLRQCFKVVELYRSCAKPMSRCRGPFTYCEPNQKICRCLDTYIPAYDNIRCKKSPRYGISYALLGEYCNNSTVICQNADQQVCHYRQRKCKCHPGLIPASDIDINAEPFNTDECRPENYSMKKAREKCIKPNIIGITNVGGRCTTDNNCPQNSQCRPIGCHKKECRCENGTVQNIDGSACKTVAFLRQPCNGSSLCVGSYVVCADNECKCKPGTTESSNNQCKYLPPIPGRIEYSALGEACHNNAGMVKICQNTVCINGYCSCPENMQRMTLAEVLMNPLRNPPCKRINETNDELSLEKFQQNCIDADKDSRIPSTGNEENVFKFSTPDQQLTETTRYELQDLSELNTESQTQGTPESIAELIPGAVNIRSLNNILNNHNFTNLNPDINTRKESLDLTWVSRDLKNDRFVKNHHIGDFDKTFVNSTININSDNITNGYFQAENVSIEPVGKNFDAAFQNISGGFESKSGNSTMDLFKDTVKNYRNDSKYTNKTSESKSSSIEGFDFVNFNKSLNSAKRDETFLDVADTKFVNQETSLNNGKGIDAVVGDKTSTIIIMSSTLDSSKGYNYQNTTTASNEDLVTRTEWNISKYLNDSADLGTYGIKNPVNSAPNDISITDDMNDIENETSKSDQGYLKNDQSIIANIVKDIFTESPRNVGFLNKNFTEEIVNRFPNFTLEKIEMILKSENYTGEDTNIATGTYSSQTIVDATLIAVGLVLVLIVVCVYLRLKI